MNDNLAMFAEHLGLPFTSMDLIQRNAYCAIYRAMLDHDPCIIKSYFGDDSALVTAEAEALDFYHEIAGSHPDLIDSRTLALDTAHNLICIQYVPGIRLSDLIYQGRRDQDKRGEVIRLMSVIGNLMNLFYEKTATPGVEPAPFLFEYFAFCSNRLERHPLLGRLFFKEYVDSALYITDEFKRAAVPTSFTHGDMVFRNIHTENHRLGVIDFANTNFQSHILNDAYNLWFAIANMLLGKDYKKCLVRGLLDGLGQSIYPEIAHRFYYEYHRRRWLMLKITAHHPRDILQGLRGLLTFASKPDPELMNQ